jgi:acetyl-CoA carboxylase/biotin carboxylase 1
VQLFACFSYGLYYFRSNFRLQVSFIGPPAEPMQALGDKIGSTIIAQSAGVPVIGWNGDDLRVDYKATGIPQSVYDQANVLTAEAALECAERIGYPVMIKASEGGGGKGN